jgi:serine/threonine protein phosphatase PrpC
MTPDDEYSAMMLCMTRSLGDFLHHRHGVTWKPEVVVKDLLPALGGAAGAVLCVASDGVWDLWAFEEAMAELTAALALEDGPTQQRHVLDFFEASRAKGAESFGDHADNLTGVVALLSTAA